MNGAGSPERWKGYADFYEDVYGQHITALHPAGRHGANLIEVHQSAGDWSDAATPDLVICTTIGRHDSATIDAGGGRFRIDSAQPGSALVIAPNFATTFLVDGPHSVRFLAIPYQRFHNFARDLDSSLPSDGDFGRLHADVVHDRTLASVLDAMWADTEVGSLHGALFFDGAILQIAATLLRLRDGPREPRCIGGLAPWQLKRVQELLKDRIEQEVCLADLSKAVDLSEAHLSRAFKASTGLPPWRWLAERRIERAKSLLADPKLSLTDVAQMVGYSGQSTFGEAFRRATGVTPGQYRREALW